MERRLPRVGFGLGRLHHVVSRRQRERIILGAFDAGLTHYDLAPAYGDGLCEAETGRILLERRPAVSFATKFGIPTSLAGARRSFLVYGAAKALRKAFSSSYGSEYSRREFTPEAALRSLEGSLKRLRTDHVDFFFVHEPRHLDDLESSYLLGETLERAKKEGKILHYGISADTRILLAAEPEKRIGDAIQFGLDSSSSLLVERLPDDCLSSAYGLMRFRRTEADRQRLDYAAELGWFFGQFPRTMPILASNRPEEIARLGRALDGLRLQWPVDRSSAGRFRGNDLRGADAEGEGAKRRVSLS